MEIEVYNRVTNRREKELVYGDKFIEWLYETWMGKSLSKFVCQAPLSKFYGALQDLPLSQKKIDPFIKKYHIAIGDYLPEEGRTEKAPYSTFNQFFIRKFRPEARTFVSSPHEMAAFSEARYYGYESVREEETVPVKGCHLSPQALIENPQWEKVFAGGPLLLARLCPVDYHRYHFPDDGTILDDYRIAGLYHSVNPRALKAKSDILITNERHVTILATKNFGKLAYIEVGAVCVGKIIQTKPLTKGRAFTRGEEKGYFLFGGSTVIVVGEAGKWRPSLDILQNTQQGIETYLHLGMSVASKG